MVQQEADHAVRRGAVRTGEERLVTTWPLSFRGDKAVTVSERLDVDPSATPAPFDTETG